MAEGTGRVSPFQPDAFAREWAQAPGKPSLRAYWERALSPISTLEFTVVARPPSSV